MKYLNLISLVLLLTVFVSCATEKKNKLEGVWELVSVKSTSPDTTIETTQADWKQIKVVTKSHFVWIGQEPNRAKFIERGSDSELLAAARTFLTARHRASTLGRTKTAATETEHAARSRGIAGPLGRTFGTHAARVPVGIGS